MSREAAIDFFAEWLYGAHHVPKKTLKEWGDGWRISVFASKCATYDFNQLTRLVFLAHDRCVRVELSQSSPQHVGIIIHQRDKREGSMYSRHPTIETALADWRNIYPPAEIYVGGSVVLP